MKSGRQFCDMRTCPSPFSRHEDFHFHGWRAMVLQLICFVTSRSHDMRSPTKKATAAPEAAPCKVSLCPLKSRDLKSPTVAPVVSWLPSLTSLAIGLPLLLLYWQLGSPSALLSDPNTGVHVRTGEWILVHHAVPREDLFSFSIQGQAWCDWEWLSDVMYALLHRWNALAAIVTVSLAVLCLMSAIIYRTACLHPAQQLHSPSRAWLWRSRPFTGWHGRTCSAGSFWQRSAG